MSLPNQRSQALLKRTGQPIIWLILGAISFPAFVAGCAGGVPSVARFTDFFSSSSPTEVPSGAATPAVAPVPGATNHTEEMKEHPAKKTARQARVERENPAAPAISRPTAGVSSEAEGASPRPDITLEPSSSGSVASTPAATTAGASTPASTPSSPLSSSAASAPGTSLTLNSRALESSARTSEANPSKATKLVQDIDKIEKRIDRKNLSADNSQRDILAQKLLQEAKKALAEHDSVAAIGLATKASTLLTPLPKLAESASAPTP